MSSPKKIKKNKKVRLPRFGYGEERENFIENLLMLLSAGMDVLSVLGAIKEEMRHGRMKKFIDYLTIEIENGSSLYQALDGTGLVGKQALALINLGERSGRLVENLKVVAVQQQKNRDFRSKVRSAMMYPIFVLLVAATVGLAVAWFIMPKISKVFSSMDVTLPLITQILISIGNFIGVYGYIAVPSFLLGVFFIIYVLFFFPWTKTIGQNLLLYLPGLGRLVKQAEIARFGFIFGTLLNAGLPIIEALDALADSAEYIPYNKFYRKLSKDVDDGMSLRRSFDSMRRSGLLLPPTVRQLVIAGEQSGSLPDILIKIGETYEAKMDLTAKNMSVLLEPFLLLIVALAVLGVAIAVILPIYSLVGSFNN